MKVEQQFFFSEIIKEILKMVLLLSVFKLFEPWSKYNYLGKEVLEHGKYWNMKPLTTGSYATVNSIESTHPCLVLLTHLWEKYIHLEFFKY